MNEPPPAVQDTATAHAFDALCTRLGRTLVAVGCDEAAAALAHAVVTAWSEPHRRYHDRRHLASCLAHLDAHAALAARPLEVEVALAFHDAVYDTRARDNEQQSAAWAERALVHHGASAAVAKRVAALVLATRHDAHSNADAEADADADRDADRDADLLVDIDLSILGACTEDFDAFERDIRDEYAWVEEDAYRAARARVLRSFLDRPVLYRTDAMRARFEAAARINLRRAIAVLVATAASAS